MIFLRLFPGTCNWGMNISFPHMNIPTSKFILSVAVGLTPYNYVVCTAGKLLKDFSSDKQVI